MSSTFDFLTRNARWLGAGVLLTFMSSFGQTFFISLFAGEIQEEFGLSHGSWGAFYMIGTMSAAAVLVWSGVLADTIRVRVLGAIVLVSLCASCVFMAVNTWVVLLPVVIFCLRLFGQGMSSHVAVVAMSRWFVATRGRALATATLGFSFGETLLPIIFVSLLTFLPWRGLWILAAVVVFFGSAVLYLILRSERVPRSDDQQDRRTGMDARFWTRREALRSYAFWLMLPAIVGHSAFGTAVFFHQVHYAEITGTGHLAFVSLIPVYTGSAIFAMILSGMALDRFGTVRLIVFYQIPLIIAFLLFGMASGLLVIGLAFVLFGLASGSNATLVNAYWAEVFGTAHIGGIKSLASASTVLGSALGPAITGYCIDLGFGLDRQYMVVAGYFVLAWFGLWTASRLVRARLAG